MTAPATAFPSDIHRGPVITESSSLAPPPARPNLSKSAHLALGAPPRRVRTPASSLTVHICEETAR